MKSLEFLRMQLTNLLRWYEPSRASVHHIEWTRLHRREKENQKLGLVKKTVKLQYVGQRNGVDAIVTLPSLFFFFLEILRISASIKNGH